MDARLFTFLALVGSCAGMSMPKSTTKDPQSSSTATAPVIGPAANQFDTIKMRDSAVKSTQPNQPYPPQQPAQSSGVPPYPPQQTSQSGGVPQYAPQQPAQSGGVPQYAPQQPAQSGGVPQYAPQQLAQSGGVPQYAPQQPAQSGGVPQYAPQQPAQSGGVPQYAPQQPAQSGGVPQYAPQPQMAHGTNGLHYQQNQGHFAPTYPTQQQIYDQQYQQYLQQQYNQLPSGPQTPTSNMGGAFGRYPGQPTKPSFDVVKAKAYASQAMAVNTFGGGDMMEQMNTMKGYGQNLARTSFYVRHEVNQFPSFGWWTTLPKGSPERQKAYWYLEQMMAAELFGDRYFRNLGIQMTTNADKNVAFMAYLDAAGGLFGDRARMMGQLHLSQFVSKP